MSVKAIPKAPDYFYTCKCKTYVIHRDQFINLEGILRAQQCRCK